MAATISGKREAGSGKREGGKRSGTREATDEGEGTGGGHATSGFFTYKAFVDAPK
ncbi:MAG TPA: hypothetical protein VF908_04090 [Gemmatimonadaceae bacterium]